MSQVRVRVQRGADHHARGWRLVFFILPQALCCTKIYGLATQLIVFSSPRVVVIVFVFVFGGFFFALLTKLLSTG